MLPRRRIHHIVATVVAVLVLSMGTGFASAVFRCQIDGEARDVCCCPKPESTHETGDPLASRACCCQVELARSVASDVRVQTEKLETTKLVHPTIVVMAVIAPVHRPVYTTTRWFADHPPVGPPLILQKCSLLI